MVFRQFIKEEDGNVAIIAALVLLPLLLIVGVGVDYSRVGSAEEKMQTVVDNAVFSPDIPLRNRPAAEAYIANMINANSGRDTAKVNITINQDTMRVEAQDAIDTPLLAAIGEKKTPILAVVEVAPPSSENTSQSGITLNGPDAAKQKRILKKLERQLEQMIKRVNNRRGGTPAQRRQLRNLLERQLSELRRNIRNQS